MRAAWKTKKLSSAEKLEKRLIDAIREKNKEDVSTFLDRLHKSGVHQGIAVDAAKEFIRKTEQRR